MDPEREPCFKETKRGYTKHEKIFHEGRGHRIHSKSSSTVYYRCTTKGCSGRLTKAIPSGEMKVTREHVCQPSADVELEKTRNAAFARLRELTLSSGGGVSSSVDIVRKFLEELSPKIRALLPHQLRLRQRVTKWALRGGVKLVRAPIEDYIIEDDDPPPEALRKPSQESLKLVDEEGRDLGYVPLDRILTAGEDSTQFQQDYENLPRDQTGGGTEGLEDDDDGDNADTEDYFASEVDYDQIHEPEVEVEEQEQAARLMTSAKNSKTGALKRGGECFLCGDNLILLETSSSSNSETFRKVCSYLNVKCEDSWFPRKSSEEGQLMTSVCDSCTEDITRIQRLYQKVKEIQSLIFKKVEYLEKKVVDVVIMDNRIEKDTTSSAIAIRLVDGFRNQVLINYRNKLKLRKLIGVRRKAGQIISEVQPSASAAMFASDPLETNAFDRVAPTPTDNTAGVMASNSSKPPILKRGRGRPKSKSNTRTRILRSAKAEYPSTVEASSCDVNDDDGQANDDNDNETDFPAFDDDATSSNTSEKELKFWEKDPTSLLERDQDVDDTVGAEHDHQDQSDPDYDLSDDNDNDEDWKTSKTKGRSLRSAVKKNKKPSPPDSSISQPTTRTTTASPSVTSRKTPRKSHSGSIEFPDVVLHKDGRIFMSGIEIIKNAPGAFQQYPHSVSFTCGVCSKTILKFWSIRSHILGHHLSAFKCPICEKKFTESRSLEKHTKLIHPENPAVTTTSPCTICGRPTSLSGMKFHLWSHLSEEERQDPQYKNYCPPHRKDPNRIKRTSGAQTFMCSYCTKTFFGPAALRRHELTHTSADGSSSSSPSTFQCQFCGKIYNTKRKLCRHNQTCSKKPPMTNNPIVSYPCTKCPARFKTRGSRSRHVRKLHPDGSEDRQKFSCSKSTRKFSNRTGFKQHNTASVRDVHEIEQHMDVPFFNFE